MSIRCLFGIGLFAALSLSSSLCSAQFNGHNTLGDYGLTSGSQPPPGFYASAFYYRYEADDVYDRNGDPIQPGIPANITINAGAGILYFVSDAKIFGGNYSAQAVVPFSNSALEAPILGPDQRVGTAASDLYLQPIGLGWQTDKADFIAGIGLTVPTGDYEFLGDKNSGLGMWSFELFGGTTLYFDKAKTWHFATTAFYETHSNKKDTNIRVGDLLTLEGGLGYSFFEGAANVGLAYYAQWKITDDDLGEVEPLLPPGALSLVGRHRVFGLGPELTLPIPINNKLVAIVNVRYVHEFGARTKTQGDTITLTITFPIPSTPLE
jgi:hypothetical protein